MKSKFTIPAIAAVGAALLLGAQASARQTIQRGYNYPSGTGYTSATATCNTGWPDFDSDCTNGNYIKMSYYAKTTAQAKTDIEYATPLYVNLSYGAHWWCNETLYCSDGTTLSNTYIDTVCGWSLCPTGVAASRVEVSFGIDNNPS